MKMKEWFKDESRWIQGAAFKDKSGHCYIYCSDFDRIDKEDICASCLSGAIHLCYNDISEQDEVTNKIFNRINKSHTRFLYISEWNDSEWITFENVKKLVNELDI